jgi:hypothetical protein
MNAWRMLPRPIWRSYEARPDGMVSTIVAQCETDAEIAKLPMKFSTWGCGQGSPTSQ